MNDHLIINQKPWTNHKQTSQIKMINVKTYLISTYSQFSLPGIPVTLKKCIHQTKELFHDLEYIMTINVHDWNIPIGTIKKALKLQKQSLQSYGILSEVIIARFSKLPIFTTIWAIAFNHFWGMYTIHHPAMIKIILYSEKHQWNMKFSSFYM